MPQEALDSVSSRTYISTLERGLKSPTLDKIDQIASELNMHPLSLLAFSFVGRQPAQTIDEVLRQVEAEYLLLVEADRD